jgi:hypothetical protein
LDASKRKPPRGDLDGRSLQFASLWLTFFTSLSPVTWLKIAIAELMVEAVPDRAAVQRPCIGFPPQRYRGRAQRLGDSANIFGIC